MSPEIRRPFWLEMVHSTISYLAWGYGALLLSIVGYFAFVVVRNFKSPVATLTLRGIVASALALVLIGGLAIVVRLSITTAETSEARRALSAALVALRYIWEYFLVYVWLLRRRLRPLVAQLTSALILLTALGMGVELMLRLNIPVLAGSHFFRIVRDISVEVNSTLFNTSFGFASAIIAELLLLFFVKEQLRERRRTESEATKLAVLKALVISSNNVNEELHREQTQRTRATLMAQYLKVFSTSFLQPLFRQSSDQLGIQIFRYDTKAMTLKLEFSSSGDLRPGHLLSMDVGVGASGRAFSSGHPIYVPSLKYGHGIEFSEKQVYVTPNISSGEVLSFKSILSVPLVDPSSKIIGVLAISSRKARAFSLLDLELASLIGIVLADTFKLIDLKPVHVALSDSKRAENLAGERNAIEDGLWERIREAVRESSTVRSFPGWGGLFRGVQHIVYYH